MLSKVKQVLPWPFFKLNDEKEDNGIEIPGPINNLPDELLLRIFCFLDVKDILFRVSCVNRRWRQLSKDSVLWKCKSLCYDPQKPNEFASCIQLVKVLKKLHLGGHEHLPFNVLKALLTPSLNQVRELEFLSSCRIPPEYVVKILRRLGPNLESLTMCLNDELVSYGIDKKTCYSYMIGNTLNRPGILLGIIGHLNNLKYLKLRGGYHKRWYYDEIQDSPGCTGLETLDVRDFQYIYNHPYEREPSRFVETLIQKSSKSLKTLKLSAFSFIDQYTRSAILECKENLQELEISATEMDGLVNQLTCLKSLHINGRFVVSKYEQLAIAKFLRSSTVVSQLREISLLQFNDQSNMILSAIAASCHNLRTFRSDGCHLRGRGITELIKSSKNLREMYFPNTQAIADRHLFLMASCMPHLILLDLRGTGFGNSMLSVMVLKEKGNRNLKIIGTSNNNFFHFKEKTEQDSDLSDEEVSRRASH